MPYSYKIQGTAVRSPAIVVYARLETFRDICFFAAGQIHYTKAVAVAFVTVTFHTLPGNAFAVRREFGICIIAHVLVGSIFLAEIAGLFGFQVIKINIRIRRNGIIQSGFLAASIGNLLRVVAPCQLLDTAERFHR